MVDTAGASASVDALMLMVGVGSEGTYNFASADVDVGGSRCKIVTRLL
jgi:hypothetical protein